MSSVGMKMIMKGKLFDISAPKKLRGALNDGIERMALVTEGRVKKQLYKGHGVVTGHLRRSVSGELVSDLKAQVDAGILRQGANVVYASWVEGVSSRNARTRFKGYKMFDNSMKQLQAENKDKYFAAPIKKAIG
tara:strand:+ start:441 stop:842 length:402 start_codon:yes stop_codon:yes gene_type:complete